MSGQDKIVKKIIADACYKCAEMMREANDKVREMEKEANEWAEEYISTQKEVVDKDALEVISRRKTVAELSVRKIQLAKKQAVIEEAFRLALDKLCSLKKADYLALIDKNITEYADDGDTVILSCDKVITAKDVEKLEVFNKKRLTVAKEKGDFIGGVYLIGKTSDKDLTFNSLISAKKQEITAKVVAELFGDK